MAAALRRPWARPPAAVLDTQFGHGAYGQAASGGAMAGAGAEAHATGSAGVSGVGSAGGSGGGSVGEVGASGEAHAGFADHHLNFGLGGDFAAGLGIDIDIHISIDTQPFENAYGALVHTFGPAIAHEAQAIGHDVRHVGTRSRSRHRS